jgi:hypothetical protein
MSLLCNNLKSEKERKGKEKKRKRKSINSICNLRTKIFLFIWTDKYI